MILNLLRGIFLKNIPSEPKPGEKWIKSDINPFVNEDNLVDVLNIESGWIKYKFTDSNFIHSCEILLFMSSYEFSL